jgi:hypothetical protein
MRAAGSGGLAFLLEIHWARGHHRGNGVFVNHLRHGIAKQNHILVKGFNLSLQLDAVDQINGHGDVFLA